MTDPCSRTENYGYPEFLGDSECFRDHIMSFLQGCRIKAGDTGKMCVAPGVLFVLRTMGKGIIRTQYYETSGNPGIGTCHQGICSNVETNMFHRAQSTDTTPGSSKSIFQCHLFIHCPLHIV